MMIQESARKYFQLAINLKGNIIKLLQMVLIEIPDENALVLLLCYVIPFATISS